MEVACLKKLQNHNSLMSFEKTYHTMVKITIYYRPSIRHKGPNKYGIIEKKLTTKNLGAIMDFV